MISAPITPSSSAEVIPFPASGKPAGFAKARGDWLKTALTQPSLTYASKTFCAVISLYFNVRHYNETRGELLAWPSWDTLIADYGFTTATIQECTKQLERCGLLEVQRGRHDGRRRAGNRYFARTPKGEQPLVSKGWEGGQPLVSEPSETRVDSMNQNPLGESKRDESILGEYTQALIPEGCSDSEVDSAKSRTPEKDRYPRESANRSSGPVAQYLMKRAREEGAARAAAARPDERKSYPKVEPSPHLLETINRGATNRSGE